MSTPAYYAAEAAKTAADALDGLAHALRNVGSQVAMQHAVEAEGAAKMARNWRAALRKQHRNERQPWCKLR